jgi:hypothetical protein
VKLKKNPKNPLVWAKKPKKPKKTQKKPPGWVLKKTGFFPTLAFSGFESACLGRESASGLRLGACPDRESSCRCRGRACKVLVEPIRGTGEAVKKDFVKQNNKLVLRP